jgi:glyoxylase-like metal-dependent hydrolase (beta-lactamase superfamily II)
MEVALVRVERDDGGADWTSPGVYEVATGVFRIPLPLPHDGLRAVNVYALLDGDGDGDGGGDCGGVVLVDSGWAIEQAREALDKALAALGSAVARVRRFLVTHVHRDHYGMAVALRREFGGEVSLGQGEEPTIRAMSSSDHTPLSGHALLLMRCGAADIAEALRVRMNVIGHDPADWAAPDDWLVGESDLAVSGRTLRVVATPGHTRGHVVFVDARAGLMFAGDHVLPHITPSIGFESVPTELPLGDYLASLRLVRALPDRRMLPAHGPVSPSVHARVDELLDHHGRRLDEAYRVVEAGSSAHAVARGLTWTRRGRRFADLDLFNQMLAVTETAAHLDLLVAQGRLAATDVDGVRRYGLASTWS